MQLLRLQASTSTAQALLRSSSRSSTPLILRASFHHSPFAYLDTERPSPSSSHFPPPSIPSTARRRVGTPPPISPPPLHVPSPSTTTSAQAEPSPSSSSQSPQSPRQLRRTITSVDQLPTKFGRNQIIEIPQEVKKELESVVNSFKAPVRYAFAYGSGVFRQKGYTESDKPLLDFVFAVSHPSHWHAVNMAQNPHHYSPLMRFLGSDAVAWMQEKGLGASVWFNVDVEVEGKTVKYGCISIDALCRDMLDWDTLYISGRTHKPVKILQDDARVRLANQVNLASAMRTSLLLLPESFTEYELFETIAGLSYRGDFRMAVGENPRKVRNIVDAQLDAFRGLYGGLLKSFWRSVYVIGEEVGSQGRGIKLMRQDVSTPQRASVASRLPLGLKTKVLAHYQRKWNLNRALGQTGHSVETVAKTQAPPSGSVDVVSAEAAESQEVWERIVADEEFQKILSESIGQIVRRPTFNQSLKGILSAGPLKSLRYIGPKLRKKWLPAPSAPKTIEAAEKA
ncbi:Mmp37-domain-containing protein [Meredithblackwellia eburnea MCA 4105]